MTTAYDPEECQRDFFAFFKEIYGYEPFPWQTRLAVRVGDPAQNWPGAIALPTAAGKTACIDIAVFALAYRARGGHPGTLPRRIFFVVDRRIVVDQAYEHARNKLAVTLRTAKTGIVRELAKALCDLGDSNRPLDVYALRGGMYREDTWVRSPLQPTVVTSTVDQVGSRLLFRGYGVSPSMAPIHAGLVGNDALILLDEAHVSRPFAETVNAVQVYRRWTPGLAPFAFVQMTATPALDDGADVLRDGADDREHPFLSKRINAGKPVKLVAADKAKGKTWDKWGPPLVATLAEQARGLMGRGEGDDTVRAVGVIVNRVATGRALAEALRGKEAEVLLLTGRMRPLDRDRLLEQLKPLFTGSGTPVERPTYVVATQCLEVGADLDFHALVAECASLDALRQRFGRLNRHAQKRTFAPGVIVVRGDQREPGEKEADFVYGNALAKTWQWLNERATDGTIDFGVAALARATEDLSHEQLAGLNAPAVSAPVLLPAHLDCWVQTAPRPEPDPDPALFLHGPQTGPPDVQIVFRADLDPNDDSTWADTVSRCPPSSSEALPVRIGDFRKWLAGAERTPDTLADVEGGAAEEETEPPVRRALRWAGPDQSELVKTAKDVWPTATYVVPCGEDGIALLGDFPPEEEGVGVRDDGDAAFQRSRDRVLLRLTGPVVRQWPTPAQDALASALFPDEPTPPHDRIAPALAKLGQRHDEGENIAGELKALLKAVERATGPNWLITAAKKLQSGANRTLEVHPLGGLIVASKRRLKKNVPAFADEESSESPARRQVLLDQHTYGVMRYASRFVAGCGLRKFMARFALAARWHDLGKADPCFQAMLRGGSPRSAAGLPLLAKSGAAPVGTREREQARTVHHYPAGGRHELLSLAFAADQSSDDLILHLIGTHHGDGRPFARPYDNKHRPEDAPYRLKDVPLFGEHYPWPAEKGDPAAANEQSADRFWRVVRRHGWWGSAFLETLFRLADHSASRSEQMKKWTIDVSKARPSAAPPKGMQPRPVHAIALPGLDGSNPLGFLAALGLLRSLTLLAARSDRPNWLGDAVRLAWDRGGSPRLVVAGRPTEEEFAAFLEERLGRLLAEHPAALAVALAEGKDQNAPLEFAELRRVARLSREHGDWTAAHYSELLADGSSQLLVVRSDYLRGNVSSILERARARHFLRTLFARWDYADALENQSLHWEPSEDRRHAYQWHQPNGDPTKKSRGGMLGANRLAFEAWPLFFSVPRGKKLLTRGFTGDRASNTFWTWPLWSSPLGLDAIASLLALPTLQDTSPDAATLRGYGVFAAFRCQRILFGKTPNLTPAVMV